MSAGQQPALDLWKKRTLTRRKRQTEAFQGLFHATVCIFTFSRKYDSQDETPLPSMKLK